MRAALQPVASLRNQDTLSEELELDIDHDELRA